MNNFLDYEGLALFAELNNANIAKKQDKITSFGVEKEGEKDFIVLKSGEEVVGKVDTTDFVVDGMLESASLVTTPVGKEGEPEVPYIKLVFNAAAGAKTIEFSVKDLVDTYTAGEGLVLENNEFKVDFDKVAELEHTHEVADVEGLSDALDEKVNKEDLNAILIEQIYALFGKKVAVVDTPEAFVDALAEGGNVCLANDLVLTESVAMANDGATLNLNGKTLTVGGNFGLKVTGKNVEISNGTIKIDEHGDGDANDRAIRVEGGTAKIENVKFESELPGFVAVQGTKNVGGSVEISDCVIDAPNIEAFAITQNGTYGGTTWSIKNTVINAENCNAAIYISNSKAAEKQNVTIEGCEVNAKGCIEVKHSNVVVKDCKLNATDAQTYVDNGNGNCTTGYDVAVTKNAKDTEISGSLVLENNEYSCIEDGKFVYLHATEVPEGFVLDTDSVKFKD